MRVVQAVDFMCSNLTMTTLKVSFKENIAIKLFSPKIIKIGKKFDIQLINEELLLKVKPGLSAYSKNPKNVS